ncbi:hypothetical protein ACHAW6_006939 [Cyclotella cf. meneghiniana]
MARDKGLMLKPTGLHKDDAYPDVSFAGLYRHEKAMDPACVRVIQGLWSLYLIAQWCWYLSCKWR